jgi:hypothetical protein
VTSLEPPVRCTGRERLQQSRQVEAIDRVGQLVVQRPVPVEPQLADEPPAAVLTSLPSAHRSSAVPLCRKSGPSETALQGVWVPDTARTVRDLPVRLRQATKHDPLVALQLIYQMFAKLLGWIVLRTRSDATKEIEILILRH